VVAYNSLSLAAGSSDKAAHQGKSKGPPEREGRRNEKNIVFDTSEATILLKIKVESFEKGQEQTDFQAQISPKMHSKTAIFADLRPHLRLARAKLQGATWRFKSVPAGRNPSGLARSSAAFGN
jgi:hypothetical protein